MRRYGCDKMTILLNMFTVPKRAAGLSVRSLAASVFSLADALRFERNRERALQQRMRNACCAVSVTGSLCNCFPRSMF